MEFALKSEIYCFIHLHSLLRIVFVHNIYYIFAKLSLANIRSRFSNKPIVHSRHRGRYTQKFKNNHFTFLKTSNCVYLIEKNPSPIVQSNCPVQAMFCTMPSNKCQTIFSSNFVVSLSGLISVLRTQRWMYFPFLHKEIIVLINNLVYWCMVMNKHV